jgi:acetylornithine deacetylase/succinyl-diaminopimelate desuccinylase-like protein
VGVDRREVIEFCRELVRIPSLSQEEGALAEAVRARMMALGYDQAWIDDMGNVVGRVGTGESPRVLFDGHLDTVGVTDAGSWRHDPFGGEVDGGRIYGRGSSDMKGSIAAMVCAAGALAAAGDRLKGTVYVSGTVCEELVEGPGLGRVIEQVRPDYVVIGESTSLGLYIGQRGRAEIVVEAFGVPAHSSTPHLGVNAVRRMAGLLPALDAIPMPTDPLLGPALLELTDIISRPYPGISVVPDLCRATFDRRLMVGETPESVITQMDEALARADATIARGGQPGGERGGHPGGHPGGQPGGQPGEQPGGARRARASIAEARFRTYTGFEVTVAKFAPAWKTPEDHPLVRGALRGLAGAGLSPRLGAYGFCTNGSYSAGKYGIPTIGFGPASESEAHTIDEFIEVESLLSATRGYQGIAAALCGLLD